MEQLETKINNLNEKNSNSDINTSQKNNTISPFFLMTLEDNNGECKQIKIFETSNPSELAYNFCKENNLDYSSMKYIKKNIKEIQQKFKKGKNELLYLANDSIKEEEDEEQYNTETDKTLKESLKKNTIEENDNNKICPKKNELLENLLNKKIVLSKLKINQISPMQKKIKQMINQINTNKLISKLKKNDNNRDTNNNENGVPTLRQKHPTLKCVKNFTKHKQNHISDIGKFYAHKKILNENFDNNSNINNSNLNSNYNYIGTDQNHKKTKNQSIERNAFFQKNYKYFKTLLHYLNSPQKTNYTSYMATMKSKSDSSNDTFFSSNDVKHFSSLINYSKKKSKKQNRKITPECPHKKRLIKNITDINSNYNPQNIYLNIKNLKQNFINNKPKQKKSFDYKNIANYNNQTGEYFDKDYFDWLISSKVYKTSRSDDSYIQDNKSKFKTYSYNKNKKNNRFGSSRDKKKNMNKLIKSVNSDRNLSHKIDKKKKIKERKQKNKLSIDEYLSNMRLGNIKSIFYTQNHLNKSIERQKTGNQDNKIKNFKKNIITRKNL